MHKRKKISLEERRLQAAAFREQRRLEEALKELQAQFDAAAKPASKPEAKPAVKASVKVEAKPADKDHRWDNPIYVDQNAFPYWEDEEDYRWDE